MRTLSRCVLVIGAMLASPSQAQQDAQSLLPPAEPPLSMTADQQVAAAGEAGEAPGDSQRQAMTGGKDLPTDEFGHPLNACELPWNYAPEQ